MVSKLSTALIGLGRIAQGYADDPTMANKFRYASHAQVLSEHPVYSFDAVVDPVVEIVASAKQRWNVPFAATSTEELEIARQIEVAVIATPPAHRMSVIEALPNLKAVIVEKPLGIDCAAAKALAELCAARGIKVQVNLLRRGDELTQELSQGRLAKEIGDVQAVFGVYGNGLLNNGTHMIDLVRMLIGEVKAVQAVGDRSFVEGPIAGDCNLPFTLMLDNGCVAMMQPVSFSSFRENGLDIWGHQGRLQYMHGGMTVFKHLVAANRMISDAREVVVDQVVSLPATLGNSIYRLYDNLIASLQGRQNLASGIESALQTAQVVDAVQASFKAGGAVIPLTVTTADVLAGQTLQVVSVDCK